MFFHRRSRELARAEMEARLQAEMASMAIAQIHELRIVYEDRIQDLKDVHELRHTETLRTIKALADEVEFLRAKHYGPPSTGGTNVKLPPTPVKARPENDWFGPEPSQFFLSEDAEDILALQDGGHLNSVEAQQALDQLRARTGLPITVDTT